MKKKQYPLTINQHQKHCHFVTLCHQTPHPSLQNPEFLQKINNSLYYKHNILHLLTQCPTLKLFNNLINNIIKPPNVPPCFRPIDVPLKSYFLRLFCASSAPLLRLPVCLHIHTNILCHFVSATLPHNS